MDDYAKISSRRILDEIWNGDDCGGLSEIVGNDCRWDDVGVDPDRQSPLLLLDVVDAYKALAPDLRFHHFSAKTYRHIAFLHPSASITDKSMLEKYNKKRVLLILKKNIKKIIYEFHINVLHKVKRLVRMIC